MAFWPRPYHGQASAGPVLALLLLCLPGCCPLALADASPLLQPAPLLVTCMGPHGHVSQRHDEEHWISCLWNKTMYLRYQPAPGAKLRPQLPPQCSWYLNSAYVKKTSRWSGQLVLQASRVPGRRPPPTASSSITVQCSSASCAAPGCLHHNLSIEMCRQDMRLFVLWPHVHLIHPGQPVELGWCARLKSTKWQYRFTSHGGNPSTLLLSSNEHEEALPPSAYPGAEVQQICATYYNYRLTVHYGHRGLHVASVSIEQMPHISRKLSLKVEPNLQHILSISSKLLSVPHQPLSLTWSLQPLALRTVAYRLLDTKGTGGWLSSYSSPTLQSNFCAVPSLPQLGEMLVASLYFHVDGKDFKNLTGELHLVNGTLGITGGGETPTYVSLHPGKSETGTYILRYSHRTSHTKGENIRSADGSNTRYILYQHQKLSYLFSVEFVKFHWYKVNIYLYINQKRSLADRDMEVHIFSSRPSFPHNLIYLVWFIPVQHPMLQCEWTFNLQVFGTMRDQLIQNNTYTYRDHVSNATRFIRRSALSFDPEKYAGFVAKVNCTRNGLAPALLQVRVKNYASKTIGPLVACQQKECKVEKVWIQRPTVHTVLLRHKKGASLHLSVRVFVNCKDSLLSRPLWRIYPVEDTKAIPDWSNPINSSMMLGVHTIRLTVPGSALDYGLYLFHFFIHITAYWNKIDINGSDSIYIQIDRTDLIANIAGGTWRTVGFSDRWALDGSSSSDPDSAEGLKGIRFTWYCTRRLSDYANMKLSIGKKCHPTQRNLKWLTSSGPVQTVAPETLQGNTIYYFRLVIQKDTRQSYADQTVHVKPGSPPLLNVVCLENCGKTVIPTERFTLSGKCLNCRRSSQPIYHWSLFSAEEKSTEIKFDWWSKTSTGRSGPYLSIHALSFTNTEYQSYILLLKVTTWDGRSSIYRYSFQLNSTPSTGTCTVTPSWGTALVTKFVVRCSGFSDINLPLTYKVIVASEVPKTTKISSLEENTFGTILYFGYQPETPPSFLPVGVPSQKYALTIYVQVYNSLGAFKQVSLYVKVQNPVESRPAALVFHELLASISGSSAPMTSYLQTGDYFNAGYLTYIAASVLNYIKDVPTPKISKVQFRENLIKAALKISMDSIIEMNQVVASIFQVTEETDEVNRRTQELAIQKLTDVTEVLKIQWNESHWSEQTEIQTSGILRCLSNILRVSLLHQKNVNVDGIKQVFFIMENLTDIVFQGKVPGEIETVMETGQWNITLTKKENWNATDAFSTIRKCKNCFYPKLKNGNYSELSRDAVISTALYEFDENPFPWLGFTSEIATTVLGFKMTETKANGDIGGIMPEGADIIIARKDTQSSTFQLAIGPDKTQHYTTGGFRVEVERNTIREVYIQIVTKLKLTFKVLVFASANITHASPIASFSAFHNKPTVARKTKIPNSDCNLKASYIICLPKSLLRTAAQESATDNAGKYNISIVLLSRYVVRYPNTRLVSISIFSDQCLFLDGVGSHWKESTCSLGSYTGWQRVHCICNMKWRHKRLVKDAGTNTSTLNIRFLAAKVIVTPNTVDLEKSLIADIPQNPVTLLTVVVIFLTYLVLALWAMKKEKADKVIKDKIIVLPDNDPFDKVCFLVTLYTGSRFGAGTTADVFLQLIGKDGTSDVHCLQHPHFPSFHQGSTDTFLLTTKKDLGEICALRVWHNNQGPSPSWFLSRAKVENLYTKKSWFFLCRRWLGLDKDDHLLERTFFVMNPKAHLCRMDYFLIYLAENLIDGHLWFSIFAHTITGTFSRLQRLSCCLAILLLNLLVNIMFFNADKSEESPLHLRYLRSIAVGVESALITIPLQMLIIALFRYSQKPPSSSAVTEKNPKKIPSITSRNLENWKEYLSKRCLSETSVQSRNTSLSENLSGASDSQCLQNYRQRRNKETSQTWSNCTISERDANVIVAEETATKVMARQRRQASNSNFNNNTALEGDNFQMEKTTLSNTSTSFHKRPHIVLCWWCVYFSWALIIAVAGLSSFFIVLYGLSYGYQTSLEWLLASAISFFENVFLLQTLKIIFLSALSTVLPKYCENIAWLTQENYSEIKLDKTMESADEMRERHCELVKIRGSKQYKPLEADELAVILKKAKTKKKVLVFLKDIISHFVFLTLILYLAYSAENTNSFYYNRFIHDQFSPRLSTVDKLEHIYTWVNGVFLPLLHNDIQPTFLSDSCSKTIGLPRMRQVRAKDTEKKCFRPGSFVNKYMISKSHCLHNYGSDTLEKGDYAGTWTTTAKEYVTKDASSYTGFTYQPNKTPWVYYSYGDLHIYGPAGYPFYFFPAEGRRNSTTRLDILQKSNWLDEKTWAVIIELTTFNPNVNLFCCISVIFEVSYFGIVNSSLSVHSFDVPIFHQQTTAQMVVFVIVLVFLFIYIADELHTICREKKDYINNISNIINLCLKSVLLLFVVLKVIKFKMGADIVKFYLLHPNDFIHFHAVSHLDEFLRIAMGFLAFLTILKTLRYSRFFYDVRLAQRSILAALPGISSMAFIVLVYFFVFMAFGHLVFGQHEWNYNNMIHSAQTVFSYCVSAFRDTEFSSNRLLGGLFLASFMLIMICVLINLFQAVIISAYEEMKQPVYEEPCDEAEVVTFLIKKIRNLWYLLIHKTSKTGDPDLPSIFYGQPQRRHHRHLGLKNRKINGKKMVYLVI